MLLLFSLLLAASPPPTTPAPVKVMIVGTFHMSNPGHDVHNVKVDDVLAPKRQAEIVALNAGLARFQPTRVAIEWPEQVTTERYAKYLAGTLPPSQNESVQLGFRLASLAGLKAVHGIDVDGDFPYEAVQDYAKTHGQTDLWDKMDATVVAWNQTEAKLLAEKGIAATLRFLNDPAHLKVTQGVYRDHLRIGTGRIQPGVELMTAWYRRNFLICAALIQLAQPGDRIVVIYGAGHAFLLRQCVAETPGFELVETNDYLPR